MKDATYNQAVFLSGKKEAPTPNPLESSRAQTRQHRGSLVKQTYSVFVETKLGRPLLVAYFTQETLAYLNTVDDFPDLAGIGVPPGRYRTARAGARTGRTHSRGLDPYQFVSMYPTHPYPLDYPHTSKSTASSNNTDLLAPLAYLKAIPPPRRHPLDEEALMSFGKKLAGWVH
ncbi:hypothetical protein C0991_004682 [Blastosporella zonata]|nr:hypothetical protein C0991_004682 [Blastosporella zonata]